MPAGEEYMGNLRSFKRSLSRGKTLYSATVDHDGNVSNLQALGNTPMYDQIRAIVADGGTRWTLIKATGKLGVLILASDADSARKIIKESYTHEFTKIDAAKGGASA